jgi:hypothetical protein
MNSLVMFFRDDDGELIDDPVWHLIDPGNAQGEASFCTGEFFGGGESSVIFEVKMVKRGGITCPRCLDKLKIYKTVKL